MQTNLVDFFFYQNKYILKKICHKNLPAVLLIKWIVQLEQLEITVSNVINWNFNTGTVSEFINSLENVENFIEVSMTLVRVVH